MDKINEFLFSSIPPEYEFLKYILALLMFVMIADSIRLLPSKK